MVASYIAEGRSASSVMTAGQEGLLYLDVLAINFVKELAREVRWK